VETTRIVLKIASDELHPAALGKSKMEEDLGEGGLT